MQRKKRDLGRLEHEIERHSGWGSSRNSRDSQLVEEERLYEEEMANQLFRLNSRAAKRRDEGWGSQVDRRSDIKKHEGKEREKEKLREEVKAKEHEVTWIKVHRKHVLVQTLQAFNLPWDWDKDDGNYIIIKQWVSEDQQEELFAHTHNIREGNIGRQISPLNTGTQ
ncbi:unnamed protein product [Penicillium glandicola]